MKREEKRIKVETRASDVITIKVESHEVLIPTEDEAKVVKDKETEDGVKTAQGESSTELSRLDSLHQSGLTDTGRLDRASNCGPTGAQGQSDRALRSV